MSEGAEYELHRELLETKLVTGLNAIRSDSEKLYRESQQELHSDMDELREKIEALNSSVTEVLTHIESIPDLIDHHLKARRVNTMRVVMTFVKNWVPLVLTIIVSLIIIRAWLSGEMSGTEVAMNLPI